MCCAFTGSSPAFHDFEAPSEVWCCLSVRVGDRLCTGYSVEGALLAPSPFVPEQGHCVNCGETTHTVLYRPRSLSLLRTVCATLRHAYVARPCTRLRPAFAQARCDDNTSNHRASSTSSFWPKSLHHRDRHIASQCTCFSKLRPLAGCGRECSSPILLVPFEFASTHCVPELGHCVPCARSRWNIGRPLGEPRHACTSRTLLHACTSRTVLHTPAAFPWAATAGQRPSAWLPTQAGPRAGPIATERVGAAGSSTPRGASASRTVNGSPSPRASSRTHVTGPTRIRQKPLELLPRVWHLHGPRCVLYFLGSMEVDDGPGSGRKDMHLHS